MGDVHVAMAILCVIAIVLLVIFVLCHSMDLLTYISSWIYSSKEEKMGLTRSKGHYNANGYLVCLCKFVPLCYSVIYNIQYLDDCKCLYCNNV